MTLRDYQEAAVSEITFLVEQENQKEVVLSAATSFGKSIVLAELAKRLEGKVIILVNITALIDQIAEHLTETGSDYSILKAGYDGFDPSKKIQLVMSQTFFSRANSIDFGEVGYILQDEAHREWKTARTMKVLNALNPTARIGVTGTPYDESGYALQGVGAVVDSKPIPELEKEGYVAPLKYYVPKWSQEINFEDARSSGADYSGAAIDEMIDTPEYASMVVKSMNEMNCKEKKCLVFANSIEHADTINTALKEDGYHSFSYHSKNDSLESEEALESFKRNTLRAGTSLMDSEQRPAIKCIVAVSKISIGFSVSDIDVGVICRPTKVMGLYRQMCGRIIRAYPGKSHGEILDLAGVISLHGFHDEPYNAPEKGDKRTLLREKEKASAPSIAAIVQDAPTEINRKIVVDKLKELEKKAKKIPELSFVDIASIYETTRDPRKIIEIGFEINRRKTGQGYNNGTLDWCVEPWRAALREFPEYEGRLIGSLRTMMKNKIAKGAKPAGIKFSVDWLLEQTPYIYKKDMDEEPDRHEYDIDEDEIPF